MIINAKTSDGKEVVKAFSLDGVDESCTCRGLGITGCPWPGHVACQAPAPHTNTAMGSLAVPGMATWPA